MWWSWKSWNTISSVQSTCTTSSIPNWPHHICGRKVWDTVVLAVKLFRFQSACPAARACDSLIKNGTSYPGDETYTRLWSLKPGSLPATTNSATHPLTTHHCNKQAYSFKEVALVTITNTAHVCITLNSKYVISIFNPRNLFSGYYKW